MTSLLHRIKSIFGRPRNGGYVTTYPGLRPGEVAAVLSKGGPYVLDWPCPVDPHIGTLVALQEENQRRAMELAKVTDRMLYPTLEDSILTGRCSKIADQVVPEYRGGKPRSCTGHYAKRWQAAWDGACVALGGDPARYR